MGGLASPQQWQAWQCNWGEMKQQQLFESWGVYHMQQHHVFALGPGGYTPLTMLPHMKKAPAAAITTNNNP